MNARNTRAAMASGTPRSRRTRFAVFITALIIPLIAASACGSGGSGTSGSSGPSAKDGSITLLQPTVAVASTELPIYVGLAKGFWSQYGINLNVVRLSSTQALPAYISKKFVFGMSDPGTLATLVARDVPVNLYAVPYRVSSFGFWVTPDIKSAHDLVGQPIGISQPGGSPYIAAVAALKYFHIDKSKVTFLSIGSSQDIVTAMMAGKIKAGSFGAPAAVIAMEHGFRDLVPISKTGTQVGLPIIGSPSWVAAHATVAEDWLKAYIESEWYILTHKNDVEAIAAKALNFNPGTAQGKAVWNESYSEFAKIRNPADLGNNSGVLASIKAGYSDPSAISNMEVVNPTDNLMQKIVSSGFLQTLQKKYGPLPANLMH